MLVDAAQLLGGDNAWLPLDWLQAKASLQNFTILFHSMLGVDHPLVGELTHLLEQFFQQ